MNQIIKMLTLSNQRMDEIMSGAFNAIRITAAQRELEDQIKVLSNLTTIYAVASKNKRAMKDLFSMNILDCTEALQLGEKDDEKVKCPTRDHLISREHCLDYSGKHFEDCRDCEIGKITKDKLLGPKEVL